MSNVKHSIRYSGVAADGTRVPSVKGLKSELWTANCAPCGWGHNVPVEHAKIVELVASHKAGEPVAAVAPANSIVEAARSNEVSKAAAKSVGLPVGSATALLAYANDAGNWGGTPWVNGNVNFGKSTGGFIGKLVAAGMITLGDDDGETFVVFTREGVAAAIKLGAPLNLADYAL